MGQSASRREGYMLRKPISDCEDFTPRPAYTAAEVMLRRALLSQPELAENLRAPGIVVVIEAPSPTWVQPLSSAFANITVEGAHTLETDDQSDDDKGVSDPVVTKGWEGVSADGTFKSHNPNVGNAEVLRALDRGYSLYGVSASPERHLPRELLRGADHRVVIGRLDGAAVSLIASILVGTPPATALADDLAATLEIEDLSLARRPGEDADRFITRLRGFTQGRLERPSLTLADLCGMNEATAWGLSLERDLGDYRRGALAWNAVDRGVLLYGPPGTGKTTFARALAGSCGVPLVTGSLGQWQAAGHLGDLLREMRATFTQARAAAPCILFIDEIDSFGRRDTFVHEFREYSLQVVNGLLEELDGLSGREGVVVIGACNYPDRLDPALVRSGRLDRAIAIPLPDRSGLVGIMRHHLAQDLAETDLSRAATIGLGSTGADVERWVRGARRRARVAGRPMAIEDLLAEIQGAAPPYPEDFRKRIAIHEAGHTVATLVDRPQSLLAISLRDAARGAGGYTLAEGDRHRPMTAAQVRIDLVGLLSGRAAEEVILGDVSGGAGGSSASSDLGQATSLATAAVTTMGLGSGDEALLWLGSEQPGGSTSLLSLRSDLARQISSMLEDSYAEARALVTEHRELVELVATELLARDTLDGDEVRALAERLG